MSWVDLWGSSRSRHNLQLGSQSPNPRSQRSSGVSGSHKMSNRRESSWSSLVTSCIDKLHRLLALVLTGHLRIKIIRINALDIERIWIGYNTWFTVSMKMGEVSRQYPEVFFQGSDPCKPNSCVANVLSYNSQVMVENSGLIGRSPRRISVVRYERPRLAHKVQIQRSVEHLQITIHRLRLSFDRTRNRFIIKLSHFIFLSARKNL